MSWAKQSIVIWELWAVVKELGAVFMELCSAVKHTIGRMKKQWTKRMRVIHSWPWYWLMWPWWGGRMYRIVTGVTSDVGVPSTYLVVIVSITMNKTVELSWPQHIWYGLLSVIPLACDDVILVLMVNDNWQGSLWSCHCYHLVTINTAMFDWIDWNRHI